MDFKVGDKVKFTDKKDEYKCYPQFYPANGYIGEVVGVSEIGCIIKWGKDSGVSAGPQNRYTWYCRNECLELVEEEKYYEV